MASKRLIRSLLVLLVVMGTGLHPDRATDAKDSSTDPSNGLRCTLLVSEKQRPVNQPSIVQFSITNTSGAKSPIIRIVSRTRRAVPVPYILLAADLALSGLA